MTSSDFEQQARQLLERARQLEAEGYERASVVDAMRADELAAFYDEIDHDAVVLRGAVQGEGAECHACLQEPGLFTIYVRKRSLGSP
jgi:hypothetical protein